MVRRRDNRRVLGMAAEVLVHWNVVLDSGRRPTVAGVRIGHVCGRAGYGGVLVGLGDVVGSGSIRIGHVVRGIHWLGDMLVVVVVVVGVGGLVVLRPATAARRRAGGGHNAHVGTVRHLLPSRQMPAIVHHAGLGWVFVLR